MKEIYQHTPQIITGGLIIALSMATLGLLAMAYYKARAYHREQQLKALQRHCKVMATLLEHKNRIQHKYREDGAEVCRFEMYRIAYSAHIGANAQEISQAIADFTEVYLTNKTAQ